MRDALDDAPVHEIGVAGKLGEVPRRLAGGPLEATKALCVHLRGHLLCGGCVHQLQETTHDVEVVAGGWLPRVTELLQRRLLVHAANPLSY